MKTPQEWARKFTGGQNRKLIAEIQSDARAELVAQVESVSGLLHEVVKTAGRAEFRNAELVALLRECRNVLNDHVHLIYQAGGRFDLGLIDHVDEALAQEPKP